MLSEQVTNHEATLQAKLDWVLELSAEQAAGRTGWGERPDGRDSEWRNGGNGDEQLLRGEFGMVFFQA